MHDDSTVKRKFEETLRLTGQDLNGDPELTYRVTPDARENLDKTPNPGFELREEIGQGGMGVVYRAFQKSLGRDVAIKKVKLKTGQGAALEQAFRAEARVTGFLDHPNIVPVHDLGTDAQGDTFLAMKLVGGRCWRDILHPQDEKTSTPSLQENLDILINVCNALSYAHVKGVIHRDIKPANIMVGEFGEVFVMDWGLGLVLAGFELPGDDSGFPLIANESHIVGTPAYMAPEMAKGENHLLGPWTDVYLLGAVLCEILIGKAPHAGDSLLETVVHASRGAMPTIPQEVPQEIRQVCERAMALDVNDRYQTVLDFRLALNQFTEHRESTRLSTIAASHLLVAKERLGLGHETPGIYTAVSDALAGFKQARLLWQENEEARLGQQSATEVYAQAALWRGDLILAKTQASLLTGKSGDALLSAIEEEEEKRAVTLRQKKRLRFFLVLAVGVIIVGLSIGFVLIEAEKERADENTRIAISKSKLLALAHDRVVRLADVKKVEDLITGAQQIDEPKLSNLAAMRVWLGEAEELINRIPIHLATLKALRLRAKQTSSAPEAGGSANEMQESLATVDAKIRLLDKQLELSSVEVVHRAVDRSRLLLQAQRKLIEALGPPGTKFIFDDYKEQWQHDVLAELIAKLEFFTTPQVGLLDRMARHQQELANLKKDTITSRARLWQRVDQEMAASSKYVGQTLVPQVGLIPLGTDPDSGLQEFLHWPTHDGPMPWRDEAGILHVDELCGLIFVLLPGGETWRGAQTEYPAGLHYDPQARDNESPVHTVVLDMFFMSKFELTQGQWLNRLDRQPSFYPPTFAPEPGKYNTLLHPLESVSWRDLKMGLVTLGVEFPTEAQWEYATRGSTTTPWWTGKKRASLVGAANLPDQAAVRLRASWDSLKEWPENEDGYGVHAPVETFAPNGFGLHHVIGNVAELCRDRFSDYDIQVAPGDGAALQESNLSRICRGGSFDGPLRASRSAAREYVRETESHSGIGVRPMLKLQK